MTARYLLGLTGNIATGKTTVCNMLRRLGAHIIDADAMVHRLLAKGQTVYHLVVAEFGPDILTQNGDIDRPRLGRIVFADPQALQRLEAVVHPAVAAQIEQEIAASPADVIVIDAIKLIESGLSKRCNTVWVVTAPFDQQMDRLVNKRGMSEADARQRILAQPPQEEKIRLADVVIRNDGSEAETESQVRRAWQRLQRARRRR